jgi:hypothetical protein
MRPYIRQNAHRPAWTSTSLDGSDYRGGRRNQYVKSTTIVPLSKVKHRIKAAIRRAKGSGIPGCQRSFKLCWR